MAKNKAFVWIIVVIMALSLVGLTGIFNPGSNNSSDNNNQGNDGGNTKRVQCLTSEVFHIHPQLKIIVDSQGEPVPGNIGILPGCTYELHTHATDGTIHVESAVDRGYTFADFLSVWGKPLEREGYTVKITVDGSEATDPNFVMKDGQQIVLEYKKI